MTTEHLGAETEPPEDFLGPTIRVVTYGCDQCGRQWTRRYKGGLPKKDPPCPNRGCEQVVEMAALRQQVANLTRMLTDGRAPALIGANNIVKAVDETARIVMEDFNMTDLKDNVREGEGVAPKLPPAQQAAADSYFSGPKPQRALDFQTGQQRSITQRQMDRIGRNAINGAYRGMAVSPMAVTPGAARGQPALTRVRTEQIK